MRHVNQALLIGVICKHDPDIKALQSGKRVCNFNLVTNKNRKDRETGDWVTTPTYHRVVVWGDSFIKEIEGGVRKGSTVQVTGEITHREWTSQDGQTRYITEVVVDQFGDFKFLEAPKLRDGTKPAPRKQLAPDLDDDEVPF